MQYQLRRYQLVEGAVDDFIESWRSGVVPIRQALGFEIVGAWVVEESNEFVWILAHENLVDADRAYYASRERRALEPDPAQYLVGGEELMMSRVVEL